MANEYDDPKQTIRLLGELVPKGFTDERFKKIHHFGKRAAIQGHLKYCQTIERFRRGGSNCVVQKRLQDALEKAKSAPQ